MPAAGQRRGVASPQARPARTAAPSNRVALLEEEAEGGVPGWHKSGGGAAQGWQQSSRAVGRGSSAMVAGSKRDGGGSTV